MFPAVQASYDDITVFVVPLHAHNPPESRSASPSHEQQAQSTEEEAKATEPEPEDRTTTRTSVAMTDDSDANTATAQPNAPLESVGSVSEESKDTELKDVLSPMAADPSPSQLGSSSSPMSASLSLSSFVVVDDQT